MPLQWIALSMWLLYCRNNEWILVFFLIRALGGCQAYTLVSLENEGLYVCESLQWFGTPFVSGNWSSLIKTLVGLLLGMCTL